MGISIICLGIIFWLWSLKLCVIGVLIVFVVRGLGSFFERVIRKGKCFKCVFL